MKYEIYERVAEILCNKPQELTCEECFQKSIGHICNSNGFSQCRIMEKTNEQIEYIFSSIRRDAFLKACAGSGKTEVVGMKAAFEIKQWNKKDSGIAILSFTNNATDVIRERVKTFLRIAGTYPHFIGTLSSFIHSYVVQPFAYKYVNYVGNKYDYSIRVIDENVLVHKNHWLINYKCNIPYINSQDVHKFIYAHQIGYDFNKKDFYIKKKYKSIWLGDYYKSENMESYKEKNWREGYVRDIFFDCKKKFWEHGFANFDDMNFLAVSILKKGIAKKIVKRFPVIIIDECQDLSENELHVINVLRDNGCCVHFIGDLNQSIYDFKRVNPDKIYEYTKDLKTYSLNVNFRSCKEIVEFSNQIIDESNHSENVDNRYGKKSLVYIEYDEPVQAIKKYEELLNKLECGNNVNRILVKQNSLRKQLENSSQGDYDEKESLIVALQLWMEKSSNNMSTALEFAGKQIAKWFGGGTFNKNYYCPSEITSVFAWRIFLMKILNAMEHNTALADFNVTYGKWHNNAKKELNRIIETHYISIASVDMNKERNVSELVNGNSYKVSQNNGKTKISSFEKKFVTNIPIMTIHSSKGCTFDTTLVISSTKETSKGGHWKKHWIQGVGEEKRIGYVACTRAKYLLVLGVPKLNDTDRNLLESYGFVSNMNI